MTQEIFYWLGWWTLLAVTGVVLGSICSLTIDKEDVTVTYIVMYALFGAVITPMAIIALVFRKNKAVVFKYKKKNDKQG